MAEHQTCAGESQPRNKRWAGRRRRFTAAALLILYVLLISTTCVQASSDFLARIGTRVLKEGSRGSDVLALQEALALLGFRPGPADGWFGSKTRAAVVEFQRKSGLYADGIVGPNTRKALEKALEAVQGGDPRSRIARYVVRKGDTLWSISKAMGTSVGSLMEANGLKSAVIYPGQRLVSPLSPARQVWVFAPKYKADDTVALESVKTWLEYIDVVVDCGFSLRSDGTIRGTGNPDLVSLVKGKGKLILALVTNTNGSSHDRTIASAVLTGSSARKQALASIKGLMDLGYDGINLDLENVDPAHREEFGRFIMDLSTTLGPAALLTVSVPAMLKENPSSQWSGAFDYEKIGRWCDAVVVMAYDQHYSSSKPGPVAALDWVTGVTSYALSRIPRAKLLLGIPSYGYEWPVSGGKGRSLPAHKAQANAAAAGIQVSRDEGAVPYFQYQAADGAYVVYYEDGLSLRRKMEIAVRENLLGVAMWRAGYETLDTWESMKWFKGAAEPGT
ncbi:MAG TPA: LysM peptidoglycan-binding domain-containing protein [Firmicutes bacterium]|nr:LysM peptidoglycan-binding domain-containing protein [Candidatus Fermentithermobacillaceae bacterium]